MQAALRMQRPACASRAGSSRAFAPRTAHGRRALRVVAVADVTEAVFDKEVLQANVPVLVDFWAPWCGPCKLMAPLMSAVEKEYDGQIKVVKIEHGSSPGLIEKYKVYGLPALIMFKDGEEVPGSHREGAITKALLKEYVTKHLAATVAA